MSDLPAPPPPPDPTMIAQWTGQLRTLIVLAGGLGLGGTWLGHITDQQINAYVTTLVTVAGLAAYAGTAVWSWVAKQRTAAAARRVAVASAVASARATQASGVPTPVTVAVTQLTPPGLPDRGVATPVSPAEAAAAIIVRPPS